MGAAQCCCESKQPVAVVTVTEPTYAVDNPSINERLPQLEHGSASQVVKIGVANAHEADPNARSPDKGAGQPALPVEVEKAQVPAAGVTTEIRQERARHVKNEVSQAVLDLATLDGSWIDHCGGKKSPIGIIKGGAVLWDRHCFGTVTSTLSITGTNAVAITIDGKENQGTFDPGPPPTLSWDDGACWSKVDHWTGSNELTGVWMDVGSPTPLCTIIGTTIKWNEKIFGDTQPSVNINLQSDGSYCMMLSGETCIARLTEGSPAKLTWNDGAVWVRDELQGVWLLVGEEICSARIATISEGKVHWDKRFSHPPSALSPTPPLPFSTVAMSMEGQESSSVFDPGPPARLSWLDGEVWMRSYVT